MSAIKDIFDLVKDLSKDVEARNNIKNELKDEFKLNLLFLKDIKTGKTVEKTRMLEIVSNLEMIELDAFLKCPFPKKIISNKKVTPVILKDINANKLLRPKGEPPVDFEELCRKIRGMIRYIKKDFSSFKEPKRSLHYIKNYIRVALRLL